MKPLGKTMVKPASPVNSTNHGVFIHHHSNAKAKSKVGSAIPLAIISLVIVISACVSLNLTSRSTLSPRQNLLLQISRKTWEQANWAIFALMLKPNNQLRSQNKTDEEESK